MWTMHSIVQVLDNKASCWLQPRYIRKAMVPQPGKNCMNRIFVLKWNDQLLKPLAKPHFGTFFIISCICYFFCSMASFCAFCASVSCDCWALL